MFLDTILKSLELVLGSAQTTTAMPITVDYVDLTSTTTTTGANDTQSNGVTAVTILAAPAASTTRKVNGIIIYNADSVAKIVTVRLNNNSTLRILISANLNVGDSLIYTDTSGWFVQDTNGNRKITASASGASGSIAGAYRNLSASATGISANISVSLDEIVVEDGFNNFTTLRSVSLTIAGTTTGANALDTGTIAASTWYSIWVIYNGTTIAGLLSASATTPTLPSGYTFKARVGWIRTDGTANKYPLPFKQFGRRVQYTPASGSNLTLYPVMVSGVATAVAVSVSNFVPTTAAVINATLYANITSAGNAAWVWPNANATQANQAVAGAVFPTGGNVVQINSNFSMVLESSNIYYTLGAGSGQINCLGWEDNL